MLLPALAAVGGAIATDLVRQPASTVTNGASSPSRAAASFEATLSQVGADAVKALHDGEAAALAGIDGKLPVQQVVDNIMTAERTLQTAVALRDKAVQAYHDVINMSI